MRNGGVYDINGRRVACSRTGSLHIPTRSAPTTLRSAQPSKTLPRRDQCVVNRRLARSARVLRVLESAEAKANRQARKNRRLLNRLPRVRFSWRLASQIGAGMLAAIALYTVVDTLTLNGKIKHDQNQTAAAVQSDDPNSRQSAEGKDEKPVTTDVIRSYRVAADLPRVVSIDKIGVKARALPMGVNSDGSMQAPINVFDTGWYTGSVKPGQKGAVIVVGHVSGPSQNGVFKNLKTLKAGDTISLENGAGTVFKYQVVKMETVKLEQVDMNKFINTVDGVMEGLNLMTCAGGWLRGSDTFDSRTMVYAKRVQ